MINKQHRCKRGTTMTKEKIINGCEFQNGFNIQKIEVLQEENKRLNQELDIKEKMLDKFMIGSGETLEKLQKENEELKAENEQLKKPCLVMPKVKQLAVPIEKYEKLYKALEEIRKEANRLLYEQNPIYGYNNSNYFEILVKYVLAKTKEVLEDNEDVEND